jgi:hypothetical protein
MTKSRIYFGVVVLVALGIVMACTSYTTQPRYVAPGDSTQTDSTNHPG